MKNLPHRHSLKALLFGVLLASTHSALAQAMASAQRGAAIAPFALSTSVSPDWGPTKNIGYVIGLDYTRFIRSIVQPSLEVRYTRANGKTVNERMYAGGLKLATSIHGIEPYLTALVGHGNIDFVGATNGYNGDASMAYSLGAGVDLPVTRHIKLRLDMTQQHWSFDPITLTPVSLSVGASYIIPGHRGEVL
jgi:opacity protein-like surface antigen